MFQHTSDSYGRGYVSFAHSLLYYPHFPFGCMFVCSSGTLTKITSKFCVKSFSDGYISTSTHQKAFILGPWVPWRVCLHSMNFGPRVHALWWGWRSKSRTPLKQCYTAFSWLPLPKTLGQTSVIHMTQPVMSWGEDQSDLYFKVEWFCLISWRLFDGWKHTWYNRSVWHKDWPHKIYVGQWSIFHGPVILPYILTIWWMKVTLDIVDQCDTKIDHIKYIHV